MAQLRCTSCDRQFTRDQAIRADFKCPECGGIALLDWTRSAVGEDPSGRGRLRRTLSRWRRGSSS
jgi:phage FluMu protein Com